MQRECAARLQNDEKLMYMDVQRVCSACHYISLVVGFQLPRCVVDFTASRHGGMYTNCIEKMPNQHVTIYPDYFHFGSLLWLAGRPCVLFIDSPIRRRAAFKWKTTN